MQLAKTSIRRPVFATELSLLSLLIVLVGAVSFNRLTVRKYRKIDKPVVTVSVREGGALAEVIETQMTKPLEDSIAGIDGVDVITSISRADPGAGSHAQRATVGSDRPVKHQHIYLAADGHVSLTMVQHHQAIGLGH